MIEFSYKTFIEVLQREYLEHFIDAEIFNKDFLEKWIPVKKSKVHVHPRGRILHILACLIPISQKSY